MRERRGGRALSENVLTENDAKRAGKDLWRGGVDNPAVNPKANSVSSEKFPGELEGPLWFFHTLVNGRSVMTSTDIENSMPGHSGLSLSFLETSSVVPS